MLAMREWRDRRGNLLACVLERRAGGINGPYRGDPARIEFSGAAEHVRCFQPGDGLELREIAARPSPQALPVPREGVFAGEARAVRTTYGRSARVVATRDPGVLEELAGFASILHVRTSRRREFGCGLIWHGPLPVIVEARFPRSLAPAGAVLPPPHRASLEAAARAEGLVACGLCRDARGTALLALHPATAAIVLLRPGPDGPLLEHGAAAAALAGLGTDQSRWIGYAERFEGLTILGAFRQDAGDHAVMLSRDPDGHVLRHVVDADGIELERTTVGGRSTARSGERPPRTTPRVRR
jgi:hypothetical protein